MYVHTNKLNGKRYVGITSRLKPEYRWNGGRGYHENTHFYAAIQKYGWENFEHNILYTGLSFDEAISLEKSLIAEWNTQDIRYGHNMTSGGEGTSDYHPSDATRAKLSLARRKENLSPEILRRRSAGLKGRKFSEEHRRKIGIGNSKPVNMFSPGGTLLRRFASAHEAEVSIGVAHSHISQCCHNQRRTAGGFMWQFAQ